MYLTMKCILHYRKGLVVHMSLIKLPTVYESILTLSPSEVCADWYFRSSLYINNNNNNTFCYNYAYIEPFPSSHLSVSSSNFSFSSNLAVRSLSLSSALSRSSSSILNLPPSCFASASAFSKKEGFNIKRRADGLPPRPSLLLLSFLALLPPSFLSLRPVQF